MYLLERERKSGVSYFSVLPPDLTKWYLPLFLSNYLDSSSWIEGTFRRTASISLDASSADPFVRRIIASPKARGQVWSDPSRDVWLTLCDGQLNVNWLLEEGWTCRELMKIQRGVKIAFAFDVDGKIYIYYPSVLKLYLFSPEGEFLTTYDYTRMKVRLEEFCVIRGEIFFTSGSAVIRWNLSSNRLFWLAEDFPLYGQILTDYHSYFLLKYQRYVLIFDLAGILCHQLSLNEPVQLFLPFNGDLLFQFLYDRESPKLIVYSARKN